MVSSHLSKHLKTGFTSKSYMMYGELSNGSIPKIGFGTYQLQGDTCEASVQAALNGGYEHIDTAEIYDNQSEIGEVLSDVDRDDVFVTSKVWRSHFTFEEVLTSTDQTLRELETEYLDLLLLHWPKDGADYESLFRALGKLVDAETVRNVGVSNFTVNHLKQVLPIAERVGVDIAVNQVEFHPYLYQEELLEFCEEHDVQLEAYAPIAKGEVVGDEELKRIGDNHGKSPVQVALRWALQHDVVAIPRSSNTDHVESNIDVFDFELLEEEMTRINNLDKGMRLYNPPFAEF